jgi:hypothetical protein
MPDLPLGRARRDRQEVREAWRSPQLARHAPRGLEQVFERADASVVTGQGAPRGYELGVDLVEQAPRKQDAALTAFDPGHEERLASPPVQKLSAR